MSSTVTTTSPAHVALQCPPSSVMQSSHEELQKQQMEQHQEADLSVSDLNDLGVSNLKCGNIAAAKACLTEAVAVMKQSVRTTAAATAQNSSSNSSSNSSNKMRRRPSTCALQAATETAMMDAMSITNPLFPNDIGFVPTQAISIGTNDRFFESPVEDTQMRTSIIIYNLALTFQMEAMMYHHPQSTAGRELFTKAHSLYVNAHRLLVPFLNKQAAMQQQQQQQPADTEAALLECLTDILYMGILNNLAQTSKSMLRFEEAYHLMDTLIVQCHAVGSRGYYTQEGILSCQQEEYAYQQDTADVSDNVKAIMDSFRKSVLLNIATSQLPMSSAAAA